MSRSRVIRGGAVLLSLALLGAACGDDDDDGGGGTQESTGGSTGPREPLGDITIAYMLPESGSLSAIIDALVKPLEMGIEEINGVGDTTVRLVGADDGTDPNVAVQALDQVLAENPSAIIGPAATPVMLAVIDRIVDEGVIECNGSNTGAIFTTYPDEGLYFRTTPSDILQGAALADLIAGDGFTDIAVIYRNDDYGVGFADSVKAALEDSGATIVADVAYAPDATTFDGEAQEVAAANPEAIALISYQEGAGVIQALIGQDAGPDTVPLYVADGFKDGVTADDVDPRNPAVLDGIRGTAPSAAPESGEATFPDRFATFAGADTPTIFSAHKYDCLMTVVLAAEQAGSTDPAEIAKNMASVTSGGEKCSTYADCHALLLEGADIDYDGASGPLEFTDAGEPAVGAYDVYTYDDKGEAVTDEQVVIGE